MENLIPADQKVKEVNSRISRNLRLVMAEKRVNGRALGEKSGVSCTVISMIRSNYKGERNTELATVVKLASGLEIDITELVK